VNEAVDQDIYVGKKDVISISKLLRLYKSTSEKSMLNVRQI
jgi:hypothetical protein